MFILSKFPTRLFRPTPNGYLILPRKLFILPNAPTPPPLRRPPRLLALVYSGSKSMKG